MKHGARVMFSDPPDRRNIQQPILHRRFGIFIEHPDTDEHWCRILTDDTNKIAIARTEDVV